jgi:hypothetical protein
MDRVPATVTWGLLAAWMVHDAEELATMARWTREARPRLERLCPGIPWHRLEMSQRQANAAIGLMGGLVAGASAAGAVSGGRSPLFQATLAGFGLHGIAHLAQSAATRGYTPGVVTAPLVVIPFSAWAWLRLRNAGALVPGNRSALWGLAAFPLVIGGVQALAYALPRPRRQAAAAAERRIRRGRRP